MAARKIYFDPATRGFLERGMQPIPARAVAITIARHAELLDGQAQGAEIVAGDKGRPALRWPSSSIEARRAQAVGLVRIEARRRSNAIADLAQRADDNADIARAAIQIALEGATTIDVAPALDRGRAIDTVRARAAALEAGVRSPLDVAIDQVWTRADG